MKIIIRTKGVKLNEALLQWIEKKLNPLEKFVTIFRDEKYFNSFTRAAAKGEEEDLPSSPLGKGKPKAEMWLEIEKDTLHHQKGPVFRAEAQLHFPGQSTRAEAKSKYLRVAITSIKDELQQKFKQYKEKTVSEKKRAARELKKSVKLSPQARFYRKGRIQEEGL